MDSNDRNPNGQTAAISDQTLRSISEQGFFGAPGTLADARAACAELLFARTMIAAQTRQIAQLHSAAARSVSRQVELS